MAIENQYLLNGLHCAACVRRVEKMVGKLPNVEWVSVNLVDQSAFVQGDVLPDDVIQAVQKLGFDAELIESEQRRREKQQQQMQATLSRQRQQFCLALVVGCVLMAFGMIWGMEANAENQLVWLAWGLLSLVTVYFSGRTFFQGAWLSLKNRTATMDTLIALSVSVAWLYSFVLTLIPQAGHHLYYEASVMILGFLNLGKFLELKAKWRSSSALEKLLDLAPKQAVIFDGEITKTIPAKAILPNMRVQALAGERLAVDGCLQQGEIWVDESMLTGEALPVVKKVGDKVRAGTVVQDGAGVYIAEQVGAKTTLAQIIAAVRHAQASKPPIAKWVDRITAVFVPVVISIAFISAVVWLALGKDFHFALSVFTTVLIIACPCALGLAIPLSTIAAIAHSAELGVLVRNIDALQSCHEIDTLVFDKTGTLTTGNMAVSHCQYMGNYDEQLILQLAKSVEQHASHPIARAIVKFCENQPAYTLDQVNIVRGQGISAQYQDMTIRLGNSAFANVSAIADDERQGTLVFMTINGETVAKFTLCDQLRPESAQLIAQFQQQGYRCIMLTGDRQASAEQYAAQLQLDGVIANVLPEQKAAEIVALQQQGRKVAMIGDGINDSPALAQAQVGVAMYQGSDIALEVADLSLMKAGLTPLAAILPFSKRVMQNMRSSLFGAFIYNILSIPLAAGVLYPWTGWLLNPMIASLAMALSSITVVLNSQRLLRKY